MTKDEKIAQWVIENITMRKTENFTRGSYSLKHSAEKELGFYVSNDELVEAMVGLGYTAYQRTAGSSKYNFNASYKLLKRKEWAPGNQRFVSIYLGGVMPIEQAATNLLEAMKPLYLNDFGGYQCNRDEAADIGDAMRNLEEVLAVKNV